MNRKVVWSLLNLSLMTIGCSIKNSESGASALYNHEPTKNGSGNMRSNDQQKFIMAQMGASADELPQKPTGSVTHYDTEALDKRVRELALANGQDPNTYRMEVPTEQRGVKIYRMIGMHVTIGPDGEEIFLPDEI